MYPVKDDITEHPQPQWMAMPNDDSKSVRSGDPPQQNARMRTEHLRSFFRIPAPLKRIFDQFPLVTYAANELPQRAPKNRAHNVLHIFTTKEDAKLGRPSFNPGCLKWQAHLKFCGVQYRVVASNNHASPSGALPYLQPASKTEGIMSPDPIPANKLHKWISAFKGVETSECEIDDRFEAYSALIDGRLRSAWLYQLYLALQNSSVVERLYIKPCSSQPFVRAAIAGNLRGAAETELVKSCGNNIISSLDVLSDAEEALTALSVLLGEDEWFFTQHAPGLFDASLFAYTDLILEEKFQWKYNPLKDHLEKHSNLVNHRDRIRSMYF